MEKIWQEIHCTESGGGCGGFIMVGLRGELDYIVEIICPKCNHVHQRKVNKGHVEEKDRWKTNPTEEIMPTMGAYRSKEEGPRTKVMQKAPGTQKERDGAIINNSRDLLMRECWEEHFGGDGL